MTQEDRVHRVRVLVVEDEAAVALLLTDVIEADGYETERVANGRQALEYIAARAYDVIISDLRMPELDGVGLYRALERQQPTLLSRLIFITGSAEQPEYRGFLAAVELPVLQKPFAIVELQELIRRVLLMRRPEHPGA